MKKSEVITRFAPAIEAAMVDCYRSVLRYDGQIQYGVYVYSDGTVRTIEQVQGDNARLAKDENDPRELYYVTTVSAPGVDVFDLAGIVDIPETEEEEEVAKAEAIEWLVEDYEAAGADEALESVIRNAEIDEY